MNQTTTVVVALIAAAGLSTMVYTIPEQRALAWGGGPSFGGWGGCGGGFGGCGFGCGGWGGCGGGFFDGCGFGCGGGFFVHKHIIQTISQTNNCTGNGDQQKVYGNNYQDENQTGKLVVCLNTAVNSAGNGFGASGLGSDNLLR